MRMLPVIACAAATGIAAVGFAAALDRLAPTPLTQPAPGAFATERVDPSLAPPMPVHAPVTPRLTMLPPVPKAAVAETGDPAQAVAPTRLVFDDVTNHALSERQAGGLAEPLDDLTVTRRNDLRNVPMIGVYR